MRKQDSNNDIMMTVMIHVSGHLSQGFPVSEGQSSQQPLPSHFNTRPHVYTQHTKTQTHRHTHANIHTLTLTHTHKYVRDTHTHTHTLTHTHTDTHTHAHTQTHILIHSQRPKTQSNIQT